ncbi:gamma-butyrobetaine hydroxylase-like domain-containing protein [Neptuniibacter sp. SY11_33]|uniref:gamma-butyrobetaine hydroxylase-like domain-containing protein n=1 Tax=Neptuniibacter sp. SY11_33 TaxID=3398215 RepID=UPI0039F5F292
MSKAPLPTQIKLHKKSRTLELSYEDKTFELSAEYLRVHSPSAEVRGHGIGNGVLQTGKKHVGIKELIPSGNYALKIVFDDGHDSGIYTWDCLHDLAYNRDQYWQEYLDKLADAGESRDGGMIAIGR